MSKHQWFYRWEPGRIVGLSRLNLSSRGLFHVLFDIAFQRRAPFPRTLDEAAEMACSAPSIVARSWGGLQGIRCEAETYLAELLQGKEKQSKANSINGAAHTGTKKNEPYIELKVKEKIKERERGGRSAPLSPQDEKTIEEGLTIIRENYPKVYHDGEPSPAFSRSLTLDRIRALAKVHGVMPILVALERYYEASGKAYFKAPQNFLGPKGPWRDYLEEV